MTNIFSNLMIGCSTGADILALGEILVKACDDGGGGAFTAVVISKIMMMEEKGQLLQLSLARP